MKTLNYKPNCYSLKLLFLLSGLFFGIPTISAETPQQNVEIVSYTGIVISDNSEILPYAVLSVENTNISTVTNSEGQFLLKVPHSETHNNLLITFLGHENLRIPLTSLYPSGNRIKLKQTSFILPEITVLKQEPELIIRKMMQNRSLNYSSKDKMMTAFYRETIKRRNTNVSLAEAIVEVYKRDYRSALHDMAALYKLRKSTDYSRLDTLVFKLMGGPFNSIYVDIMRYPELIFTSDVFENYEFKVVKTVQINNRTALVVNFHQRPYVTEPLYFGLLYIDVDSYALVRAEFDLDLTNNEEATRIFVRKKPLNARVKTTKARYIIDYRLIDDLWHYSYSRIELDLRINWKRKLFNTYYNTVIEMAATDWSDDTDKQTFRSKDRIRQSVVIQDEAMGFSDPEFWGEFNIIEPDKSIENAINKIQKQLKKRQVENN